MNKKNKLKFNKKNVLFFQKKLYFKKKYIILFSLLWFDEIEFIINNIVRKREENELTDNFILKMHERPIESLSPYQISLVLLALGKRTSNLSDAQRILYALVYQKFSTQYHKLVYPQLYLLPESGSKYITYFLEQNIINLKVILYIQKKLKISI